MVYLSDLQIQKFRTPLTQLFFQTLDNVFVQLTDLFHGQVFLVIQNDQQSFLSAQASRHQLEQILPLCLLRRINAPQILQDVVHTDLLLSA